MEPIFLSRSQAINHLLHQDSYLNALNEINTTKIKEIAQFTGSYQELIHYACLDFSQKEIKIILKSLNLIYQKLDQLNINIKFPIKFIKTNGRESFNLPYTREDAIILPSNRIKKKMHGIISHEIFHILSRKNPEIRRPLYQGLGFKFEENLLDPMSIKNLVINPDALEYDYYFPTEFKSQSYKGVPVILWDGVWADFHQILLFNQENQLCFQVPIAETSYIEHFKNTKYISHPEEVCAEYFRMMLFPKFINLDKDGSQTFQDNFLKIFKDLSL